MNSHADAAQQSQTEDLARRIGQRRVQLGMSENALAVQSGMAPRYLQELLSQGPGFDPGGFMRIAAVLGMSYQEMLEGRSDPPGVPGAGATHPMLMHLSEAESWEKLRTHEVGHIALPGDPIYPAAQFGLHGVDGLRRARRLGGGPHQPAVDVEVYLRDNGPRRSGAGVAGQFDPRGHHRFGGMPDDRTDLGAGVFGGCRRQRAGARDPDIVGGHPDHHLPLFLSQHVQSSPLQPLLWTLAR